MSILFFSFLGLLIGLSIASPAKCFYIFSFSALPIQETLHGFSLNVVLLFLVTYGVLMWFGYLLMRSFWHDLPTIPRWIKVVAGFFVGYAATIGVLRMASFILPYHFIYFPVMAILILGCLYLELYTKQLLFNQSAELTPVTKTSYAWMGGVLCVVLFLSLLELVKQGDFNFNGHGYKYYAYLIDDWKASPPLHFPIITKHYDEIIFHYFLTSIFPTSFPNLLAWWITLGMIKMSIFAFMFLFFRKIGMLNGMSIACTCFIFLGTTSLNPLKYFLLFDSSNLLFFVAHAGRLIMVPFLLILLGDALLFKQRFVLPWFFYVLSGLGLAATSISNPFWIVLMLLVAIFLILSFKDNEISKTAPSDYTGTLICYLSVIGSMMMYALDFNNQWAYFLRLLVLAMMTILLIYRFFPFCVNLLRNPTLLSLKHRINTLIKPIVLILSILVSLLFFGNMIVSNPLGKSFVKLMTPIVGMVETKTLPTVKGDDVVPEAGDFSIGDHREVGAHNEYCKGLVQFVNYYGLLLAMILFIVLKFNEFSQLHRISYADNLFYNIFIVNVAALPFLLFFMDFINFSSRAWLKSRFLEGPVYIIIFSFLYFVHRCCSIKQRRVLMLLIICYTAIPFVATARPLQIWYNFNALINPLIK